MGAGCCDEKGSETLMQERAGNLFCIAALTTDAKHVVARVKESLLQAG